MESGVLNFRRANTAETDSLNTLFWIMDFRPKYAFALCGIKPHLEILKDEIPKLNRHLINSQDLIEAAICKSVVIGRIANNIVNSLTSVCILQNCNNPIMQLWWMER